jgi:hypothetical protein
LFFKSFVIFFFSLSLFTQAKTAWKKIVSSYFERTHRKTIRKIDYPSLLNKLFSDAFTPRQVVAGFARSGIWPYDRNAVKDKVIKKTVNQSSRFEIYFFVTITRAYD